jgi:hypothetical protein
MNARLWMNYVLSPLLVAVMVGLVALTIRSLGQMVFLAWNGSYYIVLAVIASLEASYSFHLLKSILGGDERNRFRLVEIALLFLLVRIGKLVSQGAEAFSLELATLGRDPLSLLGDAESLIVFVLVLIGWDASTSTIRELDQLSQRFARPARTLGKGVVDDARPYEGVAEDQTARERLVRRFFFGGLIALVSAGLARIGLAELVNFDRPPARGLVLTVLAYFLLGLVVVGIVQFATLRNQWRAAGMEIRQELPRRWVRYTVGFVALATLIAFLLPTGYTIAPLTVLGYGLDFLSAILTFIALLLFFLILYPFAWLLSRLSPAAGQSGTATALPPPPTLALPQQPAGGMPPWVDILRALFFWALILAVIAYVVRAYLRDHPEVQRSIAALAPVRVVRGWWGALRQAVADWIGAARRLVPRRDPSPEQTPTAPRRSTRRFRLGARTPREQVLHYYRGLLRRTDQHGFPRQKSETPFEYDVTLESRLPEAEAELDDLARAFVEARYSQHPIDPEQARQARADWERVKAALQERRRQEAEEEKRA